ncbi:hypothetical protein CLAIMM_03686 [Cladophialophora immunda]|nr:hypothetical protein CLAIMM_03686 [Cladophialophora immunda]
MTQQQPVLAFSSGGSEPENHSRSATCRYDVLTKSVDFLDTWGPGYFVHNRADPRKIHAIAIGGGHVLLADSETLRFHWAKGSLLDSAPQATFDADTMMRIGTAVSINQNCSMDESTYRKSSFCALQPLDTQGVFWEAQERQAGFQGGHFCTSVARRVSLRELVTDLLPTFVNPLEQDTWDELVNVHHIVQNFTRGNLFDWLRTLSPRLQRYVFALIRAILEQLQHTGLDRGNATLAIAWPQEGDLERGLKIPCKAQTCWAQIIADAEDCATFAYVTSKRLETNQVKCRGVQRAWQNASKALVTEVSRSQPEGQPIPARPDHVIDTAAAASATTTTTISAQTAWQLEDQKTYYIKKLDSLLRVKVEKPRSASNDVAHLVVTSSNIPRARWKRLLVREKERGNCRIRERQASGDCAERVIVRAALIGT